MTQGKFTPPDRYDNYILELTYTLAPSPIKIKPNRESFL